MCACGLCSQGCSQYQRWLHSTYVGWQPLCVPLPYYLKTNRLTCTGALILPMRTYREVTATIGDVQAQLRDLQRAHLDAVKRLQRSVSTTHWAVGCGAGQNGAGRGGRRGGRRGGGG